MDTNLAPIEPRFDYAAIENADLADTTKAQYKKAIKNYLATGDKLGDVRALANYAQKLPRSSRAFLAAAIKIMTSDFEVMLKAGATPDNVDQVTAGLYRLEAVQKNHQGRNPKRRQGAHMVIAAASIGNHGHMWR